MKTISNEVLSLFKSNTKQNAKIVVTPITGNAFELTESDILSGGFKLNCSSISGGTVELGSVIASEFNLTLENYDNRFSNAEFEGAKLFVSVGVNSSEENNVPLGYFTVDEVSKGKNTVSIAALDNMVKFDKIIPLNFWADENTGNLNNINVSELVSSACTDCGVVLKTDLSTLVNHNYNVVSVPQSDNLTYRQLLSWCCQIMGVCALIDADGKLVLKWYTNSGVELSTGDRYESVIDENQIALTKLMITVADITYTSGTGNYVVDLTGNMLVQINPQEMLDNIYQTVGGLSYYPFTASTVPLPQLEPLDKIIIIGKDGKSYPTIITDWTFTLNAVTAIAGQGASETKRKYSAASPFTTAQSFIIEQNKKDIKNEIDSKIEQTRTSILLEVGGTYATQESVNASLKLNADAITAEVKRAKDQESSLSTLIQQNAESINLRVTKTELSGEVSSQIEQKADSIRLKASKISWQASKSSMTEEGVLTAQNADIKGKITATELKLDGCKISSSDIDGLPTMPDTSLFISVDGAITEVTDAEAIKQIQAGTYTGSSPYFSVSNKGLLVAANAVVKGKIYATEGEFTGKVTANSGSIAGLTIEKDCLYRKDGSNSYSFYLNQAESEVISAGAFASLKTRFYLAYGSDHGNCIFSSEQQENGENKDYLFIYGDAVEIHASINCLNSISASSFYGDVYTTEGGRSLQTQINGKAPSNHTHSGYAASSHTHSIANITNLQTTLNGKAPSNHTHSNYALTSHLHNNVDLLNNSAGYYMGLTGSVASSAQRQSVNFTGGKISEKSTTGIVLVFKYYDYETTNASQDNPYICRYIPKSIIPASGCIEITVSMNSLNYGIFGCKKLRIYDNKIEGTKYNGHGFNDTNAGYTPSNYKGTSAGVKYDNKKFRLYKVIAV